MFFGLADFATGFANLFFHIFFSLENNQISQPQIAIQWFPSLDHDHFIISSISQLRLCYLKYDNKTLY